MSYDSFIKNILESRENVKPEGVYMEYHHIIPDCMGGIRDKSNMIWLYPSEHYMAHKLLMEENPNNTKLACAFHRMAFSNNIKNGKRLVLSPEEYEEARTLFSESIKGANNPNYGKKWSDEQKQRMSEIKKEQNFKPSPEHIQKLKAVNSHALSEEHKKKISEGRLKGNYKGERAPWYGKKHTESWKAQMREKNLGSNNPMYGKKLSEERKRQIAKASSKKIRVIETGMIFESIRSAQAYFGKPNGTDISDFFRGRRKSFKGYHFEYYKEED